MTVAWQPRRAGLALAALLVGSAACGGAAPSAGGSAGGPEHLLWITVDTLRADRLGCHGHERPTSPVIDALAGRGVRFARAYAPAPWTTPSVASMFTGRVPSAHGVYRTRRSLPSTADSFPRRWRAAGGRAWAIVANRLVGADNGFDRHFDRFDERFALGESELTTGPVVERAERWLEELAASDERFFLYVHLFDPHAEYLRHPEYGFAPERGGSLTGQEPFRVLRKHLDRLGRPERELLRAIYDEEVRHTDAGIGRLLDRLDALGLTESTLVVLTSDHGEEFLEHGWLGHTRSLYEELMHVPLALAGPGVAAGTVVQEPVSLVELAGALDELLGLGGSGSRLAARARGEPAEDAPPVLLEVDFVDPRNREQEANLVAIVDGAHKLVRDEDTGRVQLFDLDADPRERHDAAGESPDLARRLERQLDEALAAARADAWEPVERELDDEELERLEALGYAGSEDEP